MWKTQRERILLARRCWLPLAESAQHLGQFGGADRLFDERIKVMRGLKLFQVSRDCDQRCMRIRIFGLTNHSSDVGADDLWKPELHEDDVEFDLAHGVSNSFGTGSGRDGSAAQLFQ